jgi:hypothetical protein
MALASPNGRVGRARNSQCGCSRSAAADRMSVRVSPRQEVCGLRQEVSTRLGWDVRGVAGATHTNNNKGTVVARNVTKGQPDSLGRGWKRAAAGGSSCRAVADATKHLRKRPTRGEVQSRSAIRTRGNGRNAPRSRVAVRSREDSDSESSQNRLGLDLLEHLSEPVKECIYFGDVLYASAIPETQHKL